MILPFEGAIPQVQKNVFLAPQSVVIGDVVIGENSSVWFNSIVRGDVNFIRIGSRTNIQDLSMVHVTNKNSPKASPTHIGDDVTVGHRVIIHGCTIGSRCLIGMGAIIMDGAVIGDDCIIGAGSVVTEKTVIPAGSLAFGSPAKVIRPLKENELKFLPVSAEHYVKLASSYLSA